MFYDMTICYIISLNLFNLDLFFKNRLNRKSYILPNNNMGCLLASISTQQSLTSIIEKSCGRYHETRKFRKCHKEKWQAFYYILSPKTCLFSSVAFCNVVHCCVLVSTTILIACKSSSARLPISFFFSQ